MSVQTCAVLGVLCRNAANVCRMAQTTERFLRISLRNVLLQKCGKADFTAFEVCSEATLQRYHGIFANEISVARENHLGLMLGFGNKLQTFNDPRLLVRGLAAAPAAWSTGC